MREIAPYERFEARVVDRVGPERARGGLDHESQTIEDSSKGAAGLVHPRRQRATARRC